MNNLDFIIFQWLNSWVGSSWVVDWGILFRAKYLWYIVVFVIMLFPLLTFLSRFKTYRKKNIELLIFSLVSAVVSRFFITELIRFFYSRPRPFEALGGVIQFIPVNWLISHSSGGSFPSGHAALAFAVAMSVYFYYPKTSILFFLAAFSISVGRVAAGLHWPSDIVGGAIVGIGAACMICLFIKKPWQIKKPRT